MAENEETSKNMSECQDQKCKVVVITGKCEEPVPPLPDKDHEELDAYKKIPYVKKQNLDDIRKTAKREAEKTRSDKVLEIKLTLATAENTFKLAEMKHESDTQKEKNRVDNEILKLCDKYKKDLLDASHAIPSLKKCESAEDLPDYIQVIYITEFHQKIADLTITYQTKLNEIDKALLEASKIVAIAKMDYFAGKCAAEALETKTKYDADLAWRKSLKAEVDTACTA